jgi:hypothetical protein
MRETEIVSKKQGHILLKLHCTYSDLKWCLLLTSHFPCTMVPKRAVFSQFHVFPVREALRTLIKGHAYNSSIPVYLVIKFLAR